MKKRWISSAHYGVTASSRRHFLLRADSSLHRSPCPPPPSRPPCSPSLSSSSPALPASVTPRRRPRPRKKKSETASSVTPAGAGHKRFPKHFRRLTLGINKQSERPGVRNEEPTLATSGRSRRLTAASRDAAIARAHPSLGWRRAQGASRPLLPSPISAAGGQGFKGSILWIANEGVGPIDGSVLRGGCFARG